MATQGRKISVRGVFETLMRQLTRELKDHGFHVFGPMAVQREQSESNRSQLKYAVILADLPRVSSQMIAISPNDGAILPGCISVMEVYPGQIEVVTVNPTELLAFAGNNAQLFSLAREVTNALEHVIKKYEADRNWIPDLVTSWS